MTDSRNIAHDKKVLQKKKHRGEEAAPKADAKPQPGGADLASAWHEPHARGFERRSKLIVVIDDAVDLAASIALMLELEGYLTCFAVTGAAGLEMVSRCRPDAVLLDFMLPDMTGADIANALRALPATRMAHILMCTGTAEETVRQGFCDYHAFLAKPVAHADLMRSLDLAFTPR